MASTKKFRYEVVYEYDQEPGPRFELGLGLEPGRVLIQKEGHVWACNEAEAIQAAWWSDDRWPGWHIAKVFPRRFPLVSLGRAVSSER